MTDDIRWKQRFRNLDKALASLTAAGPALAADPGNVLMQAGIIQMFEFTFELAWKTLKDYLESEGFQVSSPKATLRQAVQCGYIADGELWMEALQCRNTTTHTYDEQFAAQVADDITRRYTPMLRAAHDFLRSKYDI